MRRFVLVGWALGLAAWAGGCLERGLVVVLPGIEGRSPLNRAVCSGLNAGGVNWGIDLCDWTSPWGPWYNLRAEVRNRQEAASIALRIAEYTFAHPGNPVVVVGQSGGGAVALWVAEAMPEGRKIDGLILIGPAISPTYMLDFALAKTSRGIINFYSEEDWVFLGVGTTVYGTMDGRHTSSAGRVRFKVPRAGGRPKCYDRLFQIAWQEKMADTGHSGGHFGSVAEAFVANYVAPFVLAGRWDEQTVASVLSRRRVETVPMPRIRQWEPLPPRWRPPPASRPAARP